MLSFKGYHSSGIQKEEEERTNIISQALGIGTFRDFLFHLILTRIPWGRVYYTRKGNNLVKVIQQVTGDQRFQIMCV